MPYIIDGHNLIPKIPGLDLRDLDDEIQLIQILQDFCRQKRKSVEIYFDNAPPGQKRTKKFGGVTAHFVSQGTTADAAIQARLIKLGRSARNWTVVTSDRQVAAVSRESHARVISSEVFAQMVVESGISESSSPDQDANLSLNDEAVNEWLHIFGGEENEE